MTGTPALRVDRDRDVAALPDLLDDGNDAIDLGLCRDGLCSRTCRLAANIDHRRAIRLHLQRRMNRLGVIEVHAAVGEGVGGDVEDTHDGGGAGNVQHPSARKDEG
jgi:hypothetical protein